MADITKKIIDIDPGKSLVTMKQLRDETNAYREALLNLDEGSEEYVKIAKQVADNQAKINSAMSAGKKYTDDAAGSYNALQAELTKLRAEWKATGDEMERAQLAMRMNELNDQLKEMDASVGNFQRNVGNYGSVWTSLTDSLGDISQVGKDASEGLEGLSKVLNLAGAQGKAFNDTINRMKAVFKIGEGISKTTKGLKDYAAASKAAAAADNQRAAAATKAGVAVNAGSKATKAATVALKALGVAFKGAGIGILVSLVAALATNMNGVKKALGPMWNSLNDFFKKVKNVLREIVGGIVGVGTATAAVIGHIKTIGIAFVDSFKEYWSGFFNWCKNMLTTLGNAANTILTQDALGPAKFVVATTQIVAGFKSAEAQAEESFKKIKDTMGEAFGEAGVAEAFKQGQKAGKAFFDGIGKGGKKEKGDDKVGDKLKEVLEEILKTDYEQQLKNLEKERKQVLERAKKNGENLVKIEQYYAEKRAEIQQKLQERLRGNIDKRIQDVLDDIYQTDFSQQLIDLENESEIILAAFKGTEEQKLQIEQYYADKRLELEEKLNEQINDAWAKQQGFKTYQEYLDKQVEAEKTAIEATKKRKQQQIQMWGDIGEAFGNLSGIFEEETVAYKATSIAQALINAFLAGSQVLAEPDLNIYAKIAAMAAVITAGLANVANIVKVNPKGENSVSASAPAATAAAVPVIGNTPDISYTRQLTTSEEQDNMNKPIWVSVEDISSMQNRVKVRETNSSF